ncbi:MAG TPA: M48 family metalloprotease [Candidatus Deferrimicrobiaceae bacterium]|jgi:heat shock protein HtpX
MPTTEHTCPKCGAPNPAEAGWCYLCQARFDGDLSGDAPPPAREGQPIEGLTDAAEPPAAVPVSESASKPPFRIDRPISFYEAASENVLRSQFLFLVLFGLFFILGGVIGQAYGRWQDGLAVAMVVYVILAAVAWFNGSSIVLSLHDAHPADPVNDRQLINVVEEMAIAAGLPPPKVFVMETLGMNAFAAGRKPEEAVVAVTRGLIEKVDRAELQAVVAHELAHIKGRDTLYGICAAVLVGAVALLSDMFLRGTWFSGRRRGSDGSRGNPVFLLLGIALALLAPLAAKILQMSISRQREYHADAGAAEFTRNPLALASALEKIADGGAHVPGENRGTQHLFIVNPLQAFTDTSSALMSTHPPTVERIRRLRAMAGAG